MYVKLFDSILRSSVWVDKPLHVRVVWIGLLLLARPGRLPDGTKVGLVSGTRLGLARAIGVEQELFDDAMAYLTSPDPESTSPEFEGRRVLQVAPNLLAIVNYWKYRNMRDPEAERAQSKVLMQDLRESRRRQNGEAAIEPEPPQVSASEEPEKAHEPPPSESPPPSKPKKKPSSVWVLEPGEEPVLVFPCEGTATEWGLSRRALEWLKDRYRQLDVEAELRSAEAWLVGNPERIKTARGMPRFLVNWMERAVRDRRGFRRQLDLLDGVEDLLRGAEEGGRR